MFYRDDRLALFIDGSNLYSAARALGFDIDYKKLLGEFASRGKLVRAFYYTALLENEEYSPIRPLVDWLDYNGYSLVTKPSPSGCGIAAQGQAGQRCFHHPLAAADDRRRAAPSGR